MSRGNTATTNMLVDTVGCPSCGSGAPLSQVIVETDGSGNIAAAHIRAGNELLEVIRPGSTPGTWSTKFVHHDGLGSVRGLTDETGTTTDTREYEAFGTRNTEAGDDPLTYGFAGEPLQTDSMLAYHRARWMDARVGRFEGMDQADADPQRPLAGHRYIYGGDEPVGNVDPSGNEYDIGGLGGDVMGGLGLTALPIYGSPALFSGLVVASTVTRLDQFAIGLLSHYIPISRSTHQEYGGHISLNLNYTYDYTKQTGLPGHVSYTIPLASPYAALWHTHGSCDAERSNEEYSEEDMIFAGKLGVPSYLGTPSGAIKKYDPSQNHPNFIQKIFGGGDGVTVLVLGDGTCAYP